MYFSDFYYKKIIKYDILNKFYYSNLRQIPKLKKIVLNFGYNKSDFKQLISGLLALEIISSKKGIITKSSQTNITLKIKKGIPIGCKVILKKNNMYSFYFKLITFIFAKTKQPQKLFSHIKSQSTNSLSFKLNTLSSFSELENYYHYFKNLPPLDVTILTTSTLSSELFFLLKSLKFSVVKPKIANVT